MTSIWAYFALEMQNIITALEHDDKDELRMALERMRDKLFEMAKANDV